MAVEGENRKRAATAEAVRDVVLRWVRRWKRPWVFAARGRGVVEESSELLLLAVNLVVV